MTGVWYYDLAEPLPETAAALLPAWRRARYDSLRYPPARRESLAAGLLYGYALRKIGLAPDTAVTILPAGKPVFTGRTDWWFSLSHSGRYALCAVSGAPIGADVQRMREVRATMARRFHPAEQQALAALPEAAWEEGFFRLWTRKEAWVKLKSRERMLSLSEEDVLHPSEGLAFRDYVLPGGYLAAVCASAPPGEAVPVSKRELLAQI